METPASAFLAAISVLLCSSPALGQQQVIPEKPSNHCIAEGGFHKESPSPEEESLAVCQSWQDNSCCTNDTAWKIEEAGYELLYNFTWSMCGDLSQECTAFMQVQCGDSGLLLQSWNSFWVLLVLYIKSPGKFLKFVYCRMRRAFTSVIRDWVPFNFLERKSLMMSQYVHLTATAGLRLAKRTRPACRTGGLFS
jgi:hypothetical protein